MQHDHERLKRCRVKVVAHPIADAGLQLEFHARMLPCFLIRASYPIGVFSSTRGLRNAEWGGTIRRISTELIELELATLKQRVAKLEATVDHKPQDAWKKIVGAAKDDDLFEEAMKLGAEWRAKANEEGR